MSAYARCLACWAEFDRSFFEKEPPPTQCPNCESKDLPAKVEHDVRIELNWNALRILVMWAERWADRHIEDRYALRVEVHGMDIET